jgi:hypothetical protein
MTVIAVARPFQHGQPPVRYAIGLHDVDDAIAQHPYVIAHCEAAVVAAGGVLVQHRPSPHSMQSAGVNVFSSSMQIVGSIAPASPDDPVIEHWPPHVRPGHTAPGIEPPPIQFPQSAAAYDYYYSATGRLYQLRPVDDAGMPLGDWQPAPPTPIGKMILRPPDVPPEDPQVATLMRVQREAAAARMRGWRPV